MQPEKITNYFTPNPKPITHLPPYSKPMKYYGDNADPEFINKVYSMNHIDLKFYWENLCRIVDNMDNSRPGSDSYRAKMEERRDIVYRVYMQKDMEAQKKYDEYMKSIDMDDKNDISTKSSKPPLKKPKFSGGEHDHDGFLTSINMKSEIKPKKVVGKPGLRPMPEKLDLTCHENLSTSEDGSDGDNIFSVAEESQKANY